MHLNNDPEEENAEETALNEKLVEKSMKMLMQGVPNTDQDDERKLRQKMKKKTQKISFLL